ncbi:MAG: tRNA-guanine transglycosylase [Planctomycetes bacterium]|nr:tRNA-guanine transglycosylase [Planctomycetota bacterium]
MLSFKVHAHDSTARSGLLTTAHGVIETPAFMTVGTLGAAKGLTPAVLREHGAQVLLMNAFHLAWRPGEKLVQELGGLHRFSGWDGPILTDSGGFQIFSLPGLRKITEDGALFASPTDGAVRNFSPEAVVEIETALGADMIMMLDQCPAFPFKPGDLEEAVERSIRWAQRGTKRWRELLRQDMPTPSSTADARGPVSPSPLAGEGRGGGTFGVGLPPTLPSPSRGAGKPADVNLFGIIQGGFDEKLRARSIESTCALDLPGYALGGFCVGEPIEATHAGIAMSASKLPADRPRYLMGMGSPQDILYAIGQGLDLFDCTLPTRNGRNGMAFTSQGPLRLRNARHAKDAGPLDPACNCYTCRTFSRAFLRHLFLAREMNAAILASLHNVAFYLNLMQGARRAIREGRFEAHRKEFLARYGQAGEGPDESEDEE